MSVSLVSIKSETAVSYQSSHCDDHRVGCSGDGYRPVDPYGAYLVLLKAIEAFKELQLGNQSADSVTRLRQSLLGLAFRVRDHEKESQELRDQLARSEESLRLCKARAANAEHHLAILTLAVSRLGIA